MGGPSAGGDGSDGPGDRVASSVGSDGQGLPAVESEDHPDHGPDGPSAGEIVVLLAVEPDGAPRNRQIANALAAHGGPIRVVGLLICYIRWLGANLAGSPAAWCGVWLCPQHLLFGAYSTKGRITKGGMRGDEG